MVLRAFSRAFATAAADAAEAAAPTRYSKPLRVMHWLTAPALMGCIGSVMRAQDLQGQAKADAMFTHKSLGLLTGILVAPRLAARLTSAIPSAMPSVLGFSFEHKLATLTHFGLYGFMIAMPVTGISMGYFGGKGLPFFFTTLPGKAEPNGAIAKQAFSIHKTLGTYGKVLVPLHIGASGAHALRGHSIFARINPFK
eukprot:TRINITY_DN9224_c0_g1_i1.p1 TRINITY_DN9224_c0_g1~~TRINITY_DN9224_c0_g1_i1.p1  ORF type:complete len:197 (+),score=24.04 TRINITY_DN9224_c0_g1_i1:162-752(+)